MASLDGKHLFDDSERAVVVDHEDELVAGFVGDVIQLVPLHLLTDTCQETTENITPTLQTGMHESAMHVSFEKECTGISVLRLGAE